MFWSLVKRGRWDALHASEHIGTPPRDLSSANGSVPGAGLAPGDPQTHLDDFTVGWPVSSEGCEQLRTRGLPAPPADMANRSNASAPYYSYEYYLDYLDLLPVDEKELRAHKRESGPGGRQAEAGCPQDFPQSLDSCRGCAGPGPAAETN